jgi:hypothetical protein
MANRSCAFTVTLSESAREKPSGIPSVTALAGREASVSSSFPSWLTLDGVPTALGKVALAMPSPILVED